MYSSSYNTGVEKAGALLTEVRCCGGAGWVESLPDLGACGHGEGQPALATESWTHLHGCFPLEKPVFIRNYQASIQP